MKFRKVFTRKTLDATVEKLPELAGQVPHLIAKTPAMARELALQATPLGRRRLALEKGALHTDDDGTGLKDLDATGVVPVPTHHGDIPVRWYEVGPLDADITVVFVHGFTLAGASWYLQFEGLRKKWPHARLLTLDLRGHGQTGKVAPELCTVEGAADDVQAVLNARAPKGKIVLVGHSLGGLVALNLVRRAPEELYKRITGLVLVSTSIEELSAQGVPQVLASPIADQVRAAVESSPKQVRKLREDMAAMLAPTLAVAVFTKPTDYERIVFHAAMINDTPLETFVGFLDDLQNHEESAVAPRLQCLPGAVVVGTKDLVTPEGQADVILQMWPKASRVDVDGAGHMVILESPNAVNNAISRVIEAALAD